jgi:hypothetical protein
MKSARTAHEVKIWITGSICLNTQTEGMDDILAVPLR